VKFPQKEENQEINKQDLHIHRWVEWVWIYDDRTRKISKIYLSCISVGMV